MKSLFKVFTTIAILFCAVNLFSQVKAIGNTIPLDSATIARKDTAYIPVYLIPAGSRWDTIATIEFAYVGYNNQLFYDNGYVLQEVKLYKAGDNTVTEQGNQQVVNMRGKKFVVDTKEVTGTLSTCACYIYNYKQPVPINPRK